MITEKQCKKIIDTALAHARGQADGIEVHVFGSDVATSRFANNGMTQNQAPSSVSVSVRVIVDGRQARLSSDRVSPSAVRELVDNAIQAARLLEKDPHVLEIYNPAGESQSLVTVDRYDRQTARLGPNERAAAIKQIIDVAKSRSLSAAGVYASGS